MTSSFACSLAPLQVHLHEQSSTGQLIKLSVQKSHDHELSLQFALAHVLSGKAEGKFFWHCAQLERTS